MKNQTRKLALLFVCVCLFQSCQKKAKQNSISSVENDSISVWLSTVRQPETSIENKRILLQKIWGQNQQIEEDTLRTKILSQVSLLYKRIQDSIAFKNVNQELRRLAKDIGDGQSLGEAYWDMGDFYGYTQPDSAYYYYQEAYDTFLEADLKKNNNDYPGRILYVMAQVKNRNKDYVGAEKDVVKAISFYKKNESQNRLFDAYNLLANIQNGLNNFEKALEYQNLAKDFIAFRPKKNRFRESAYTDINIAEAHARKSDYQTSADLFQEILNTDSLKAREPKSYAKVLASLAHSKLKRGDTDYKKMQGLLVSSNQILDSISNTYEKARNQEFLAEVLAAQKDTAKAIEMALIGKDIARQTNNNDRLLSTLKLLTKVDKENSDAHATAYFDLSDSLQTQERNIRDKFARIEMETDEVIQENETLARQKKIWSAIALGVLLLAIATYIIITQRAHNQKLKLEQEQQKANQEIYSLMLNQQGKVQEGKQLEQKRISEELHDGILGQMLGIRLILSGLNDRADESAVAQRAELIAKLQELEEEIRTISHELNDASYQKIHNFILAVEDLVDTVGESADIEHQFSFDEKKDWDALEGELKINLYRIIQECLQNCVKHAQCDNIDVNLEMTSKTVKVVVADDGKGFDTRKAKKGIGVKNITSRVEKLSGTLNIKSSKGNGTTVKVSIPLTGFKEIIDANDSRRLQEV